MKERVEKQLMLYCATTHLDERKTGEIRRLLDGNIDWEYILADPSLTCITHLLFYNLKKIAGKNAIPKSVVDRLRVRYVSVLLMNMRIYRQLHEVLERLQNEGIPVILLKGVALAETVYPDIALRPMSDIDFLVRRTDLRIIMEIFRELGYDPLYPMEYFGRHHHLPPYRKIDAMPYKLVAIEVHHNIVPEPIMSGIDADQLWKGAQTVDIAGIDALVLSPENLILHLCFHLSNSCFVNGMRALVDISQSIRYYGRNLNWRLLIKRSKEFGVGSSVYHPLRLAEEMMDIEIPTYVLNSLKLDPKLRPFEARLLKTIAEKNILRNWYYSSFPSQVIIFLHNSLCKELLFTSGIGNRVRNIGITWLSALDRAYHRHIRKDYRPGITKW